jgi:predicted acyl esterase
MGAASARFILFYVPPARSLTPKPPREASSATTYRFDPARPVPSIGGNV